VGGVPQQSRCTEVSVGTSNMLRQTETDEWSNRDFIGQMTSYEVEARWRRLYWFCLDTGATPSHIIRSDLKPLDGFENVLEEGER